MGEKINMDDLIQEIYETEAPELPGFLDKEQQKRIEERIMAVIYKEQSKTNCTYEEGNDFTTKESDNSSASKIKKTDKVVPVRKKKKTKRRFLVLGLAAVLLLGLCIGVFANSNPDWDIEMLHFMGLDEADTFQLDSGEVEIQVYDTCEATEYDSEGNVSAKEVKIMAVSSIGDKNSACIRIETDYELPEGFDDTTDYILPEHYSIEVYEKAGKFVQSAMGSTFGYINDNGKLGYMIYIVGCKNLNKSYVQIKLKDFYLYHDLGMEEGGEEEELLLEGEWELNWKYAYKSNTDQYKMFKQIEVDGVKYYITNIEISPLSVQIDGFRMPWDRAEDYEGFIIDEIRYRDSSSLDVGGFSSAGNHNGIQMESFLGTTEMGTTIDVENVVSVVIGGNEVKLR